MTSNPHREGRFNYRGEILNDTEPAQKGGGFVYRGEIALGVGVDSTTFTLNKRHPE